LDSAHQGLGHAHEKSLKVLEPMRSLIPYFVMCVSGLVAALLPLTQLQANDAALGKEIYQDTCAACHGRDMVSPGLAFDLRQFPLAEFERFQNSVLNGKPPGMPAWRSQLSSEDIKALWDYVKTRG
jgi:mono/diheme cytochrome c family protein